ncbi:hypothetical protein LCGC14_1231040 [marine sediment metagenome]|uniref:Uncharacterized protein n=1 Tax=marine sediment metagenome TaxID=412755 RepID=A0A0F9PCT6_9ZZZZ
MTPTIFIDFVGAALKLHGASDAINDWPPGEYDMAKVLGISPHEFWRPINYMGEAFWAEMPSTRRMYALMALVCEMDWYIASKPRLDPACVPGKLKWLADYLNPFSEPFDRYVFTPHKHLLASSGRILIDDSDAEIAAWHKAGGYSILWPAKWNSDHEYADDPITRIRYNLRQIGVGP